MSMGRASLDQMLGVVAWLCASAADPSRPSGAYSPELGMPLRIAQTAMASMRSLPDGWV